MGQRGRTAPESDQAKPCAPRERREIESRATASSSTMPVTMNRGDDPRPSSVRPLEMDWMTTTPSNAEKAEPRPPKRLVPP